MLFVKNIHRDTTTLSMLSQEKQTTLSEDSNLSRENRMQLKNQTDAQLAMVSYEV